MSSSTSRRLTKVLLIGPSKSGKTSLANFLSDAKEATASLYRPTVGCRILEFQLPAGPNNGRSNSEIQLWDCGCADSTSRYGSCLPALANEASAVLLVYDVTAEEHVGELEELYQVWNNYLRLHPSRYLIVGRKWADGQPNRKRTIKMGSLARLARSEWDFESEAGRVQTEFNSFISSVMADVERKREEDEITILK